MNKSFSVKVGGTWKVLPNQSMSSENFDVDLIFVTKVLEKSFEKYLASKP